MVENWKERTELLIGKEALKKLSEAKVIVYGIGGVGSFAVEALVRAGVGYLVLVDNDTISMTNLNRQIHATRNTIGRSKVEVMKERILEISPNTKVDTYLPKIGEEEENLIDETVTYVIDAVDTVTTKLKLIVQAKETGVPIISCMGAGNKLDPTKFEIADIYKTSVCPLAKVMRKELKKKNIKKLKVVYSKEEPQILKERAKEDKKRIAGSISFVPSVAGFIMAGEVIKDIIKD